MTVLDGVKLAPFHLLASEGRVHTDRDHVWHMDTLARLAAADRPCSSPRPIAWSIRRMSRACGPRPDGGRRSPRGGEGMVVKPLDFTASGRRGLIQPAIKCRGREYLRLIYGPEYAAPANLDRLRQRRLGPKRALALREFALGVEALQRFVEKAPLYRVHECVFGVLALESEPVDPRL